MSENRGPLGFPRLTDRGPFVKRHDDNNEMIEKAKHYDSLEEFIDGTRPKKIMRIDEINTEFNKPSDYDETVDKMVKTLKAGGELPPILVSEGGWLQDGRHRLKAYMVMDYDEVPVVIGIDPGSVQGGNFEEKMKKIWEKEHKYG